MTEEAQRIYSEMKGLSSKEVDWIIRNISYNFVAYWGENDKAPIYSEGRDQINIEQACRLQRHLSGMSDLYNQSLEGRIFGDSENGYEYFEDLLTDNFYSKYKEAASYKEDALKYRDLCE